MENLTRDQQIDCNLKKIEAKLAVLDWAMTTLATHSIEKSIPNMMTELNLLVEETVKLIVGEEHDGAS